MTDDQRTELDMIDRELVKTSSRLHAENERHQNTLMRLLSDQIKHSTRRKEITDALVAETEAEYAKRYGSDWRTNPIGVES